MKRNRRLASRALIKLRKKHGLSQGDLAKALDLKSPQAVSNTERGLAGIPKGWLRPWKHAFGLSDKELWDLIDAQIEDTRREYAKALRARK